MAKYLLLYSGGSMPETEAEQASVMKAWDSWFHELGSAIADGGNPFTQATKSISSDGAVSDKAPAASGYSILEADSLDAAAGPPFGGPAARPHPSSCSIVTVGGGRSDLSREPTRSASRSTRRTLRPATLPRSSSE